MASSLPARIVCGSKIVKSATSETTFHLISDPDIDIKTVVIQAPFEEDPFIPNLLAVLRKNIMVVILCDSEEKASALWEQYSDQRLRFIISDKLKFKKWARDTYVVLTNPASQQFHLFSSYPNDEKGPKWIAHRIMESDCGLASFVDLKISQPTWNIEGSALSSDQTYAYIGNDSFYKLRNALGPGYSRIDAFNLIGQVTRKKVVVLSVTADMSDRYHIPVGKTKLGDNTSVLADPMKLIQILTSLKKEEKETAIDNIFSLGMEFKNKNFIRTKEGHTEVSTIESALDRSELWDFMNLTPDQINRLEKSPYVQSLNHAEQELASQGIRVVRVPTLANSYESTEIFFKESQLEGKINKVTFPFGFYYTNIIQDHHKGKRTAIIPKYGVEKLDAAVYKIYKDLDCFDRIHQINGVVEGVQGAGPRSRVQVLGF